MGRFILQRISLDYHLVWTCTRQPPPDISIFSNQNLGIDLSNSGSGGHEQDPRDPDTGANNLQNFAVITSATTTGTTTTIAGTLNSKPRKPFTIQLFSNPSATDEGKTFLGQL